MFYGITPKQPMTDLTKTILELDDVKSIQPDLASLRIINKDTCEKIQVIIFAKDKFILKLLTTNNFSTELQKLLIALEKKWYKPELHYTSIEGFQEAMTWFKLLENEEEEKKEEIKSQKIAEGTWAIAMIQKLFEKRDSVDPGEYIMETIRLGFQTWASDIHFQSDETWILTRIRIDGVLQEVVRYSHDEFRKYLQKLKYISGTKMNIDYLPQDGRFSFQAVDREGKERKVDARVNFMPGVKSESTVIRFLDPTKGILTFEEIWFEGKNYEILNRNLEKNTGITIFTWPTWSGKTTTLYSVLNHLNDGKRKIITLEDPIEYELTGIQQSQINYTKDYTYEVWLKSILRHDPDIILVGETRSWETADISINAALTGHLVFTTLHTNSAVEGITRLLTMWVKPYMLAPSLNLIVAQRLIRKVCPHCSTKRAATTWEDIEIKEAIKKIQEVNPNLDIVYDGQILQAVGCEACNGSWYKWRVATVEAFEITDEVREMIVAWVPVADIYEKIRAKGYLTMKEDGILKMLHGKTTLDELRRVL